MNRQTSHLQGLTAAEAERLLTVHGPNEIDKPRTRSLLSIARGTLREPMFLLLLLAVGLYLVVGDLGEGLFLSVGAGLTIGLVIYQEARSEGALKALRSLAQPTARVIRDGEERSIATRLLVPGDFILVGEGDRLPADARLVNGGMLSADESTLTGESAPVAKRPAKSGEVDSEAALFAGTMIVNGLGAAVITETGPRTEFGKIGASLAGAVEEQTPLQKTAHRLVGMLGFAAIGFCIVVFVAYGYIRNDWMQGGLTAITVAISLLPEEFPMVLAVFLALGAWRLARHNVLVRRSAVIEALGGATLLCVDKTGTLTLNSMKLVRVWVDGAAHDLNVAEDKSDAVDQVLRIAALASATRSIDPMDRAIMDQAPQPPIDGDGPHRTWPLRPERLAVIQLWREAGRDIAAAKGAPETIFRMCSMSDDRRREVQSALDDLAAQGFRVLGVASATCRDGFPGEPDEAEFEFHGLIAFMDPLREDAPQALREAREAGIDVVMITGDHRATAIEIARQAGIDTQGGVLSGQEIDALNVEQLRERVGDVRVFARIKPEQKLRLVNAFRANGEIVVMTGDGVNDGPALQASDIGVAMGKRGTDVAREAADIVLLDDSFASIVGGVRLGRRIFANLRKALTFITAVHVPLAGLAITPILLGWPPLFLPMHVVLLELVIDPACSLVFEAEPSEARAMRRPPRRPDEPLFGPRHIAFAAIQGLGVLVVVAIFYGWALSVATEIEARGAAFSSLVIANLSLALADAAGGRAGLFDRSHLIFWVIASIALATLAAVLTVPFLRDILQMAPPSAELFAVGAAVAVASGGWYGVVKLARNLWWRHRAV